MKFPSFSRDSWLIAIMGVGCIALGCGIGYYFHFVQTSSSPQSPNSPAPATSPSASPSSPPSSPPTSPPAPELPLLDKLQSNLPILKSKLDAVFKALDSVKTEPTPDLLRSAWTNVDAEVDQLCTKTVSPLKQQIEQQSNKDTTDKTIVDLFNQIGATCDNINRNTDRLKANNQQPSESQPTVDSPETNIKQELQNIKQLLLNQVKEWVSQEQEKKYRESLDKRLDLQNQYLQIGLFMLIVLQLIGIAVVLYKKGDKTVTGGDGKLFEKTTITKNNTGYNGLLEKETLNNINQSVEQSLRENGEKFDKWLKEQKEKLSTEFIDEIHKKLLVVITDLINNKVDQYFKSCIETKLIPLIKQEYESQKSNLIANQNELVATVEDSEYTETGEHKTGDNSSSLSSKSNNNSAATSAGTEDDAQIDTLNRKVKESDEIIQQLQLEKDNSEKNTQKLKDQISQLEKDLDTQKNKHLQIVKNKDDQITRLSLTLETTNAQQDSKVKKTNDEHNPTQGIPQEIGSLVNKYNQSKGDLNVLKSYIPVKDNSSLGDIPKGKYKLQKTEQDQAKFYIVSYQDKHYLFPKLTIPSNAAYEILKYYFEVPQISTPVASLQLIEPSKVQPISDTEDSWELVDEHSQGKVK